MNKEITIYELIGLLINCKQPKKIKIDGEILCYCDDVDDYKYYNTYFLQYLFSNNSTAVLNRKIEILDEENDGFEDIENVYVDNLINPKENDFEFARKINKLIENQKKIIEKLEEK